MAKVKAEAVRRKVNEQKLITIVRTKSASTAVNVAEAVAESGLSLIDIPVTVPDALSVIESLAGRGDLLAGAGSVTTINEAADVISAGASFIICPHTDRTIIDYCRDNSIFVAAGGLTPTEAIVAHLAGVDLVAIFPVQMIGGVEYTTELLRPMPFLNLMPVGHITINDALEHLKAGAYAVGITDAIVDPETVSANDYEKIRLNAKLFYDTIVEKKQYRDLR